MKQIKLEVGKQYLRQNGTTVTVVGEYDGRIPFVCSDGFWRRKDGTTPGATPLTVDLIKEIREDEK